MFLTPRWLLSHVFVAVLIVSFIGAGLWQVNRLGERQDRNAQVEARATQPARDLDDLRELAPDQLEFTPVSVSGSFTDREVLVANRSNEGTPGFWMWSELAIDGGGAVVVNRGFIGRAVVLETEGARPLADAEPPAGPVTIVGRLRLGIDAGRLSESADEVSRPDPELVVATLDIDTPLDPSLYVELIEQTPPQASGVPTPLPDPDLSEGPHRSYAFQWFTFATIGVVGYALLLLRIRRGDASRGDVPSSGA